MPSSTLQGLSRELEERLRGLTEPEQRILKAVRRFPGSDSKTLGNIAGMSRFTALGYGKNLEDDKNVLKSDRDKDNKDGSEKATCPRKTIHFWLADHIPAELVDTVLGISDANPEALLTTHKRRRSNSKSSTSESSTDSSPRALFERLPLLVKELAIVIGRTGDEGISPLKLAESTDQNPKRIYERLPIITERRLAFERFVPGFKSRRVYVPSPELKEIVEQLLSEPPKDTSLPSVSVVDIPNESSNQTMDVLSPQTTSLQSIEATPSAQATLPQSIEAIIAELIESKKKDRQLIIMMAKKINQLEKQLERFEAIALGKSGLEDDEIVALLYPRKTD